MIHFPPVKDVDIAFSCAKVPPKLLEEAKQKGFDRSDNPHNKLFNQLFFKGGQLNWRKDVSMERRELGGRYLKSIMSSFEPRHEDKEAVCAYILSELVEA